MRGTGTSSHADKFANKRPLKCLGTAWLLLNKKWICWEIVWTNCSWIIALRLIISQLSYVCHETNSSATVISICISLVDQQTAMPIQETWLIDHSQAWTCSFLERHQLQFIPKRCWLWFPSLCKFILYQLYILGAILFAIVVFAAAYHLLLFRVPGVPPPHWTCSHAAPDAMFSSKGSYAKIRRGDSSCYWPIVAWCTFYN